MSTTLGKERQTNGDAFSHDLALGGAEGGGSVWRELLGWHCHPRCLPRPPGNDIDACARGRRRIGNLHGAEDGCTTRDNRRTASGANPGGHRLACRRGQETEALAPYLVFQCEPQSAEETFECCAPRGVVGGNTYKKLHHELQDTNVYCESRPPGCRWE